MTRSTTKPPRGLTLADIVEAMGEDQVLIHLVKAAGHESQCASCGASCYLIQSQGRTFLIDRRVRRMRTRATGPLAWMLMIHACHPEREGGAS